MKTIFSVFNKVFYKIFRLFYKILMMLSPSLVERILQLISRVNVRDLSVSLLEIEDFKSEIYKVPRESIPSGKNDITIAVTVFNQFHIVERCLRSIYKSIESDLIIQKHDLKILVSDDASNFPTRIKLQELQQELGFELYIQETNLGVVKNVNFLWSKSNSDYVFFLNSDVEVPNDFFSTMLNSLRINAGVGLVTSPMFQDFIEFLPAGASFHSFTSFLSKQNKFLCVDACTAVSYAILVNKKLYSDPMLMDEIFGRGYGEESDLHYRVIQKGLKSIYCLGTCVSHLGGSSFGNEIDFNFNQRFGRQLFFEKWSSDYLYEIPRLSRAMQLALKMASTGFTNLVTAESRKQNKFNIVFAPELLKHIGGQKVILDYLLYADSNNLIFTLNRDDIVNIHDKFITLGNSNNILKYILRDYEISKLLIFGDECLKFVLDNKKLFNQTNKVFVFQGLDDLINPNYSNLETLREGINYIDELLIPSNFMLDYSRHFLKEGLKKTKFSPQSLEILYDSKNNVAFEEREFDFCLISRNEHGKANWLSAALANLFSQIGYKVSIATSENFPYQLDSRISRNYAFNNIELKSIIGNSRCFVETSLYEGFGLVAREALLAGTKVVNLSEGGVREIKNVNILHISNAFEISEIIDVSKSFIQTPYENQDIFQLYDILFPDPSLNSILDH